MNGRSRNGCSRSRLPPTNDDGYAHGYACQNDGRYYGRMIAVATGEWRPMTEIIKNSGDDDNVNDINVWV